MEQLPAGLWSIVWDTLPAAHSEFMLSLQLHSEPVSLCLMTNKGFLLFSFYCLFLSICSVNAYG